MINKILKKHKLTMEQFHDKYPTEADFAKAHPKDYAELQKFAKGGKLPEAVLRARLESHMSSDEAQDYINEYGKGGYTVTRSNDRKGKTHKVTGPDGTVKYFGDSKLGQHPGNPKRKKAFYARHAKNLKNNPYFRAFARATWAEGGYLDGYTEQDFAKGGRFWKDFGAGAYGAGEGLLDTLSMGLTDNLTDKGYAALQNLGNSTEDEKREQDAVRGFANTAGAIGGAILNPAATGSAIAEGTEGLGAGISKTWQDNEAAQMAGQILPTAGNIASMFTGNIGAGSSQAAKFAGSDFGKMASMAGKAGKYYNMFSPMMAPMMNAKGGFYNTIAGSLEGNMRYEQGGELVDLVGPKHTEGGIMLTDFAEVEGGETKYGNYILPVQVDHSKGVSFAEKSKRIRKKYSLRKGGDILDNEQMHREMLDLIDDNEAKLAEERVTEAFEMAKGGWIKKATESIKRRGTEGVCTGSKFGGPTCPPGSKRYNLAKTFRKMAKSRKHEEGGFTGHMYDMGGDIEMFDVGGNMSSSLWDMAQLGIDSANMEPITPLGPTTINTSSTPNSLALPPAKDPNKPDWDAVNKYLNTPKPESQSAAQLFGKYGSLLGLPLQAMAVGQANRAIKDEIKRLEGEKPEVVDYGTVSLQGYKPSLMDPTQALLEADQVARTNAYNSAQIGAGNLGTAMANKQISDLTALRNKAKTRKEYDNINREIENRAAEYAAQVGNQGALYNKELQRAGMDASSLARANYQNQLFKLRQGMGQNRAYGLQAGATGLGATAQNVNYNQQLLGTLGQLFSNPETLKMLAQYGAKTT